MRLAVFAARRLNPLVLLLVIVVENKACPGYWTGFNSIDVEKIGDFPARVAETVAQHTAQ
jgi:hypothetical protein